MPIQSTFYDPVVGLDLHMVGVIVPPSPVPVPTPIPIPFVGMVFDPAGLLIGAAISMAFGGSPGVVLVNEMPVTNCGTDVWGTLGVPHIPAPGVIFMKTMAPVYTPNDAALNFGSLNTSLAGSFGVRLGDIAMSCSDPVRLPSSVVIAIPKGLPVLNMAPMAPDIDMIVGALKMKLGLGLLRAGARLFRNSRLGSAFFRRTSHALGGCEAPKDAGRWRQMWHRGVRFVTGHPVDVVTGNLFTEVVDASLPGPIPLDIERVYESAGSDKRGSLGWGWNHSLDEALWMERGCMVARLGDGREVEFPLWDLPHRRMRVGDQVERLIHKMRLTCTGQGTYEIDFADRKLVHEYGPVPGGDARVAKLLRIRTRDRAHAIELHYDGRGLLEWVRDSSGRLLRFEHDAAGRVVALKMPTAHDRGWSVHRAYEYDAWGDLVKVTDSQGKSWRYQYKTHLLVQETDRAGLSFYFQYDGIGALSKCVRTWGDGGIYDHEVHYDAKGKRTVVEDSCGACTVYEYDVRNQVVKIVDPIGGVTLLEHDPETGTTTREVDPSGAEQLMGRDERGNLIVLTDAAGATTLVDYDEHDQPVRAVDPRGGEWRWGYDRGGRVRETTLPDGAQQRFEWQDGLLVAAIDPLGRRTELAYDEARQPVRVRLPNGAEVTTRYDGRGRVVRSDDPRGGRVEVRYDSEDRTLEVVGPTGLPERFAYDAEGNMLAAESATRSVRFRYGHFHRVTEREEDGTTLRFTYDTEDRLVGVTNEHGETYTYELDPAGNVSAESGFDGARTLFVRDGAGRTTTRLLPSGRASAMSYDAAGRLSEVTHDDGTFARFTYDEGGQLVRAESEGSDVRFERDVLGRVVRESQDGGATWVGSGYYADGTRGRMETSLGARQDVEVDPLGEVGALHHGDPMRPFTLAFARDALGAEVMRAIPGGLEVHWSRDAAGRPMARRTVQRVGPGGPYVPPRPGEPPRPIPPPMELDLMGYEWRGDDQIAALTNTRRGDRRFEHDRRGRLIREQRGGVTIERAMDAVGNVYRRADGRDRVYGPGGVLEVAQASDGSGVIRYAHDADGNQTEKVEPDGTRWTYRWNGHGMLAEVERRRGGADDGPEARAADEGRLPPPDLRLRFSYDPFARRVSKTVLHLGPDGEEVESQETRFVWDGHVVAHEIDTERGETTWYWEPETFTPVAKEQGGKRWSIASDHLGTPTEMYDEVGRLAWRMQLDVYGVATFEVGQPEDCPWRWPGQYEDRETGEYYNRFRYYHSTSGVYASPDPIRTLGGTPHFAYVVDPLELIDPYGLSECLNKQQRRRLAQIRELAQVPGRSGTSFVVDNRQVRQLADRFLGPGWRILRRGRVGEMWLESADGRRLVRMTAPKPNSSYARERTGRQANFHQRPRASGEWQDQIDDTQSISNVHVHVR
ncbi:MAG: RHS repeat protein [Myxococcales bacterium]|nr:RHS repeat protein [Myxococcales bacterium]